MRNVKKGMLGIALGALLLSMGAFGVHKAQAYHGDNTPQIKYSDMSAEQKATFQANHERKMQEHKAKWQNKVQEGRMTQQEADQRMSAREEHYQAIKAGKVTTEYKQEHKQAYKKDGKMGKHEGKHNKHEGKYGLNQDGKRLPYAELNDAQKEAVQNRHNQKMQERKLELDRKVQAGEITQDQANARLKYKEQRFQDFKAGKISDWKKKDSRMFGQRNGNCFK